MAMARSLFSKLFLPSGISLLVLLVAGGFTLDRYLTRYQFDSLRTKLSEHAKLTSREAGYWKGSLQDLATERGEISGIRLTIIDAAGIVLADSQHNPALMENHAGRPEIAVALEGRRGNAQRMSPTLGVEMLYVAEPTLPVVRAALPFSDVNELLWQMRMRILVASLPAALIAVGLAYWLSRMLTGRFRSMRRFAGQIARGDFDTELKPTGGDELTDLERSLTALKGELKWQMHALEAESGRLRSLADGLVDGVIVFDSEGLVETANRMALLYLRLDKRQAQGMVAREAFRIPEVLERMESGEDTPADSKGLLVSWPNPVRDVEVFFHTVPDAKGAPGKMVVLRDVTRRLHLERVRSDFISNMAHELRTPLTAIKGSAETLADSALADPEAAPRFISTIHRHAVRLENILSDISDLARIEAGGAPVTPTNFDGRTVVDDVVELFAAEAQLRKIKLKVDLPEGEVALNTDREKVESILINLVQNGLRYTQEGSVTIRLKAAEDGTLYTVEDTGIGMPTEALDRITERFYRVDPGRSRAQGGTGLGLSIVSHLIELLGGRLKIESELGRGTKVKVWI